MVNGAQEKWFNERSVYSNCVLYIRILREKL